MGAGLAGVVMIPFESFCDPPPWSGWAGVAVFGDGIGAIVPVPQLISRPKSPTDDGPVCAAWHRM